MTFTTQKRAYDFSRLRILIVDDSMFMRRIVGEILGAFGVNWTEGAADGAAALEKLHRFGPDVVICDWDMQPMSGLEFLRRLRDPVASLKPYIPVVMLTGYSAKARVVQARDFGTTEFLTKPVTARALYARLVELVDNPRLFVRTSTFFGPCRRRTMEIDYDGPERRVA